MTWIKIPLAMATLLLAACARETEVPPETTARAPAAAWPAELAEWRKERDESLRRPDGWLSLVGLYWLEEGDNSFGSDPGNDLIFPPPAPAKLGTFTRSGKSVEVAAEPGVELTVDGEPAPRLVLASDAGDEPTVLAAGSLSFYVIERGERVGIRLKDSASPLLASFTGMDYYPADPAWRVEARWLPYDEPRTIGIPNIIGDTFESSAPGVAVFEVDGREVRLEPTGDPTEELFFVFGDETNGQETYGGGRFLDAGPPAADGSLVLDFNRAYNPPCVFTPYATCPLPRPEDRLALAVEAGEKRFGAAH